MTRTFMEKFPVLNNKIFTFGEGNSFNNFIRMSDVEEHCLSKQRVKEAIGETYRELFAKNKGKNMKQIYNYGEMIIRKLELSEHKKGEEK